MFNHEFIERGYPKALNELADHPKVRLPQLPYLVSCFVFRQLYPDGDPDGDDIVLPRILSCVFVFHSALAVFHAPSDPSGVGGMRREWLRVTPSWRHNLPRYDCVLIKTDTTQPGFKGLHVARIKLFSPSSIGVCGNDCALIHWFEKAALEPDALTGMWIVEPETNDDGTPNLAIIPRRYNPSPQPISFPFTTTHPSTRITSTTIHWINSPILRQQVCGSPCK